MSAGAALGQVASHLGVDTVVIRSNSDLAAGEAANHFERFVTDVSANSARIDLLYSTGSRNTIGISLSVRD
jgi:nucleoside phosphorylase